MSRRASRSSSAGWSTTSRSPASSTRTTSRTRSTWSASRRRRTGSDYLGVFLTITNNDDEDLPSAHTYQIYDTTHRVFRPLESDSPFALDIGAIVPVDEELPLEDSTAATGPTESAMLLYLIPQDAPDNRPLNMEIQSVFGDGLIKLDL